MNGDTLYAWQELDETGWGVIASVISSRGIFAGGPVPLVFRDLRLAEATRELAIAHGRAAGNPIRLARFEMAGEEA